jgi:hypothetical protein
MDVRYVDAWFVSLMLAQAVWLGFTFEIAKASTRNRESTSKRNVSA